MSEAKGINKQSIPFEPLLTYLAENESKIRILLSGIENGNPILYPIKGKRRSKTVFIAEKLQCLINEYCIEKEIKIADVIEISVIQYLIQAGYEKKLIPIMNSSEENGI